MGGDVVDYHGDAEEAGQVNMTASRRQTLLEMCGTQLENITLDDAEWICEQWMAEIMCEMAATC